MERAMTAWARLLCETREQRHRWLAEHHDTSRGIWLVTYQKNSGHPYLAYADAVEEALCFGWIDSRPNALDGERSMRFFSPRRPRSAWSRLNKTRVARLIAEGRMADAGRAAIGRAKLNGAWALYDGVEELTMPRGLASAFRQNVAAGAFFEAFSPSAKKHIYWWIESAKRLETRTKRIAETVALAEENRKSNQYRK